MTVGKRDQLEGGYDHLHETCQGPDTCDSSEDGQEGKYLKASYKNSKRPKKSLTMLRFLGWENK